MTREEVFIDACESWFNPESAFPRDESMYAHPTIIRRQMFKEGKPTL